MDTKEYTEYRQSMKDYWDYTSSMRSNYELGVEKGMEKGIERGIEQGLEKGLEEGRLSERINLVKRLHQKGMPGAEIADLTGLSEAEIKDILDT
jgi:predicted transposase/invertase (TIGR01784 family)